MMQLVRLLGDLRGVPVILGSLIAIAGWSSALGQSAGPSPSAAVSVHEAISPPSEQTVQLVGILTSEPVGLPNGEVLTFFQDPTGGLSLISANGSVTVGRFRRGDVLRVTGRVSYREGT